MALDRHRALMAAFTASSPGAQGPNFYYRCSSRLAIGGEVPNVGKHHVWLTGNIGHQRNAGQHHSRVGPKTLSDNLRRRLPSPAKQGLVPTATTY